MTTPRLPPAGDPAPNTAPAWADAWRNAAAPEPSAELEARLMAAFDARRDAGRAASTEASRIEVRERRIGPTRPPRWALAFAASAALAAVLVPAFAPAPDTEGVAATPTSADGHAPPASVGDTAADDARIEALVAIDRALLVYREQAAVDGIEAAGETALWQARASVLPAAGADDATRFAPIDPIAL
jgi:hypothetical protein